MKRRILMLTVALFIASSCSRKNAPTPKNEAPAMQKESTEKIQEEEPEANNRQPENPLKEIPQKIDIDFTKMNYNMAYSIMFEMMVEPEKYKEKTVKISGQFNTTVHDGTRYFAVINWDLTGCCPTGLNFIPPASMKYPEDFPEKGTEITVTGAMKEAFNGEETQLYFFAASVLSDPTDK